MISFQDCYFMKLLAWHLFNQIIIDFSYPIPTKSRLLKLCNKVKNKSQFIGTINVKNELLICQ